jgi:D-tyrosyl-tRNA(Tyr) deacylase
MRIVLQRVKEASVTVEGDTISSIGPGLLLLVGVANNDSESEAGWLAEKISGLRIMGDEDGKMNRSVKDTGGAVLAVSQFTLLADTRKGRRPSFIEAAQPDEAAPLFYYFCERLRAAGVGQVEKGRFGAMMDVALVNDGPVTIVMER